MVHVIDYWEASTGRLAAAGTDTVDNSSLSPIAFCKYNEPHTTMSTRNPKKKKNQNHKTNIFRQWKKKGKKSFSQSQSIILRCQPP
jgi:hypothetical protein